MAPKLKTIAALKSKPKVYSLKPIVHIIEKPVPVFHKVPVPKKVFIPKFYPVMKPIPIPKIVPVPFKVPYQSSLKCQFQSLCLMLNTYQFLFQKKVPKFVPFPVKKIIKVPKPYYVPIKVPYVTTSYVKTPMMVPVPKVKKTPGKYFKAPQGFKEQINFIEPEGQDIFKVKDSGTDEIKKFL
ncbi:hypothetical protein CEXT_173341 [Caerostris extrusa]|uniref:Uncharacterized protein n=1 Tax=Caerostris extrusa TaxID=172846 RepID=A0AAV4MYW7_CAEEX|nr:hypothetical protein CEXT_173341 [Caerostris extrusa]